MCGVEAAPKLELDAYFSFYAPDDQVLLVTSKDKEGLVRIKRTRELQPQPCRTWTEMNFHKTGIKKCFSSVA